MDMKWFATVIEGFEDIAADEVRELLNTSIDIDVSKIFFEYGSEAMYRVNFMSRTINRLYILLAREYFKDLYDIYRVAKSIDYTSILSPEKSFAVRCERIGSHSFTSLDVARVIGQAVIDSYLETRGVRLRVDLDNPDIELYALVRHNEVIIGVNTTGESLHRRGYRVYNHPAALKTTIAASMIRLSGYRGEALLDPLCGGGTIPIEAAHMARKYPINLFRKEYRYNKLAIYDPEEERRVAENLFKNINYGIYEIFCVDIGRSHIEGALKNAEAANVKDTIKFILGDATRRETYRDISPKKIVTNPPYGMRSHNIKKIEFFYRDFLSVLKDLYSGVRLVLITASSKEFERASLRADVNIIHKRIVKHGGLDASVYVIDL